MPTTNWIIQAVLSWVTNGGGILIPMATTLVNYFAIGVTAYYGLLMLADVAFGAVPEIWGNFFLKWVPSIWFTKFLLGHLTSPLPWGGTTFAMLLPEGARQIVGLLNSSTMTLAIVTMDGALAAVVPPTNRWDWLGDIFYALTVLTVWFAEGVMFAVTNVGYVFIGIGVVVAPLSIACRLYPPLRHLWRMWLDYMISWSMFQVVAASVMNIWARVLIFGIPQIFHSNGPIEAIVLLKAFLLLNVALAWIVFRIDRATAQLYGHAVSGAAGYAEHLRSFL